MFTQSVPSRWSMTYIDSIYRLNTRTHTHTHTLYQVSLLWYGKEIPLQSTLNHNTQGYVVCVFAFVCVCVTMCLSVNYFFPQSRVKHATGKQFPAHRLTHYLHINKAKLWLARGFCWTQNLLDFIETHCFDSGSILFHCSSTDFH